MTARSGSATDEDRHFLERARALAREGWGRVHPNPMVGCVVVRDGRPVGEGYHRDYGGDHAEVEALREAGEAARGATVYVSLEPCDHQGKTPPCTDALLRAEVERVVYGAPDPGERSGGGAERLRRAGVEVVGPLLDEDQARHDNPAFFHQAWAGTTYVEVKLAMSLDARIAEAPGRRTTLTGAEALRRVHRLRAGFDGILVGARTVEVDDPLLTVREGPAPPKTPVRIVVDSRCGTDPDAALFQDVERAPVVLFTTDAAPDRKAKRLESAGARVVRMPASPEGVDLSAVLAWCWKDGIRSILCEGGGELAVSLLREGLCQRVNLFLAPRLLGPDGVPAFPLDGRVDLFRGWRVIHAEANVGRDGLLVLEPERGRTEVE